MKIKKRKSVMYQGGVKELPPLIIDNNLLHNLCRVIVSSNKYIRPSNLLIVEEAVNLSSEECYREPQLLNRFRFLKYGLEAKLKLKIEDKGLVYYHINKMLGDIPAYSIVSPEDEISSQELDYVLQTTAEILRHRALYSQIEEFISTAIDVKSYENFLECGTHINKLEEQMSNFINSTKRLRKDSLSTEMFSLSDKFEERSTEIYNRITDPSRRLKCGIQGFNLMLNGGFESSRVYSFFGVTGVGKSLTLTDIALQVKECNKNYKCKDPSKKPVIVILTMENSIDESVARMATMATHKDVSSYSNPNEWIKDMRNSGLAVNNDSPIDIMFIYKPNRSINTDYLYQLYDELSDNGMEMIMLIQDHLKRIRPKMSYGELRLDLGENVNDFKVFANDKGIPVLTNSHLNRGAAKMISEGITSNTTAKMSMGDVGESMIILDNLDFAIIINVEYDMNGNKFLAAKLLKGRGRSNIDIFVHPYYEENNIRLIPDYNTDPIFKNSINEAPQVSQFNYNLKQNMEEEMNKNSASLQNYINDKDRDADIFGEILRRREEERRQKEQEELEQKKKIEESLKVSGTIYYNMEEYQELLSGILDDEDEDTTYTGGVLVRRMTVPIIFPNGIEPLCEFTLR